MADIIEFGRKPSGKLTKTEKVDVPKQIGTPADEAAAAKRPLRSAKAAVALKIAGASYDEIAETLEYVSPAAARLAVEGALAASVDAGTDYRSLRAVASLQLDGLLKSVWGRARDDTDPDQLAYGRMALSVIDRKIKLHGIDAPQMITIIDPSAEEFEKVIAMAANRMGAIPALEGDIFQLEQAPDGENWGAADDAADE